MIKSYIIFYFPLSCFHTGSKYPCSEVKELLQEIFPQVLNDATAANRSKSSVRQIWREKIKSRERLCRSNDERISQSQRRLADARGTYDRLRKELLDNEHMIEQINILSDMLN